MHEELIENLTETAAAESGAGADQQSQSRGDAAGVERRRSHREPHAARAWLSSQSGRANANEQHVMVNDLSLHGIGFVAKNQLYRGAVYWMVLGTGQLHVSSRVRVASCRPRDEGGFSVGAEFF